MNPLLDFIITIVIRFVGGFILGCILAFGVGFRKVLRAFSEDRFPMEWFLLWGGVAGILCLLTTPRHMWPWTKS